MADSSQDKNLPASAKRLRDARRDGNVPRSRDLGHLVVVAGGLAALNAVSPKAVGWLQELVTAALRFDATTLAAPRVMIERMSAIVAPALGLGLTMALLTGVLASVAAVAAGGWCWSFKPLMPAFGKLDPLSGLGRIVSKAQVGDMLKACLLALILMAVGGGYLWVHRADFASLPPAGLSSAIADSGERILSGLWLLVLVLAAAAAIDVPLQRFLYASRLKMSVQELKEEHKQQEGSPEIKGRIKQRMREIARRRMLAAVPTADLVVMNPTHFAVALKYDEGKDAAPKVVAKGADLLAFRIRDLARDHKVPVLQAPPLARALYAHAELEREIPAALFTAVAQVLAYVYQLRNAMAGRGAMPDELPAIAVPDGMDPLTTVPAPAAP